MIISSDISSKIDPPIADVLSEIKDVADQLHIPFFLVGAGARDIFFSALFGIKTRRASLDIDIGIKVSSWGEVAGLIDALLTSGRFVAINRLRSRFRHSNGALVDIVPFGIIENPSGKVKWPASDLIMTTIGFEEAFECSIAVQIKSDPAIAVQICTPPSMVILKIIAWYEKYPERAKDAQDIQYILESYIDAGNDHRLDEEDADLRTEENFDYGMASPRILGRDITKIANAETISLVQGILERETKPDSEFRLLTDMTRNSADFEEQFEANRALLIQLIHGMKEQRHTSH